MSSLPVRRPLAFFRVDATPSGGVGHAMRCVALAQAWKDSGGDVLFAMASRTGFLDEVFSGEGWEVKPLEAEDSATDAALTGQLALQAGADWVVLDGYHFGPGYERTLRKIFPEGRVLVVDDRLRETGADLFVVPSVPVSRMDWFGEAHLLGGWKYALLRRDFRSSPSDISAEKPVILVVLGGTDSAGLAPVVAGYLGEVAGGRDWKVNVVSNGPLPGNANRIVPGKDLSLRLKEAVVVVCTASTVALEACACGIPQVVLVVADNQIPVAEALCSAGAAVLAGGADQVVKKVVEILGGDTRERMARVASSLVDGYGACRVANAMMAWNFDLRAVGIEDSEMIRQWANDAGVRAVSFQQGEIARDVHATWFQKRLADPACWMRIAVDSAGRDFGLLRIEGTPDAVLSISLQASHRGLGLGERLLTEGCAAFFRERPQKTIFAEVKPDNTASIRAFKKAGFTVAKTSGDRIVFQFVAP